MIELPVTLTSTGGAVSFAYPVPLGYTKNKGVYRLLVTAEGEWEGMYVTVVEVNCYGIRIC